MQDLTSVKAGKTVKVSEIHAGRNLINKLEALGIRPGVTIKKISSQIMHGPIIVKVGQSQIAIGFGMAQRIMVESEKISG